MENFWDFNVWSGFNIFAILLISLLVANIMKRRIPGLQESLIPTSVLGGGVLIVVAAILSPIVAAMAQMAVSREREYLADASAVNITRYPEGMISALKKLQSHSAPMKSQNTAAAPMYINDPLRKGFFDNLFSTHPPIEKRIERLESGKKTF